MIKESIATATEVRSHWKDSLNRVEQGESIKVTRHGHRNVSMVRTDVLETYKSYSDRVKARTLEVMLNNEPDVVNALHPILCEIMDAKEITNPVVLEAIAAAQRGEVSEFELPHPDTL